MDIDVCIETLRQDDQGSNAMDIDVCIETDAQDAQQSDVMDIDPAIKNNDSCNISNDSIVDASIVEVMSHVQISAKHGHTDDSNQASNQLACAYAWMKCVSKIDSTNAPVSTNRESDSGNVSERDESQPPTSDDDKHQSDDDLRPSETMLPDQREGENNCSRLRQLRAGKISLNRNTVLVDSTNNVDTVFYGAFPSLFPLGQGLEQMKKGFTRKFHHHLLSQFTNAIANNQHALFLMFNMHMKSISNAAASIKLKNRTDVAEFFESYVMDNRFLQKARRATKNPHGDEAAEIQRVVMPYLKMTGSHIPFSEYEKQNFHHEVWSMTHRFGEPGYFITLSPSHDTFTLRFSFPSLSRTQFPATPNLDADGVVNVNDVLQDPQKEHIDVPCRKREYTINDNDPVDDVDQDEEDVIVQQSPPLPPPPSAHFYGVRGDMTSKGNTDFEEVGYLPIPLGNSHSALPAESNFYPVDDVDQDEEDVLVQQSPPLPPPQSADFHGVSGDMTSKGNTEFEEVEYLPNPLGKSHCALPAESHFAQSTSAVKNSTGLSESISSKANIDNGTGNKGTGMDSCDEKVHQVDMKGDFITFNTSKVNLAKFASEHPVACARMFKKIVNEVLDILIGIPLGTSRKSKSRLRKGIVGYPRALAGCAETQGRGALHMHLIVWAQLDPLLVQYCASCPALMDLISRVVETHLFSSIPAEYHVNDYLEKRLVPGKKPQQPRYTAMDIVDIVDKASSDTISPLYLERQYSLSKFLQLHSHAFTCHKGAVGPFMCRMARPQPCVSKTRAVELDGLDRPPTVDVSKLHCHETWKPSVKPQVTPIPLSNRREASLPVRARSVNALKVDSRILKVDLIRPKIHISPSKLDNCIDLFCKQHNVDVSKDFVKFNGSQECKDRMIRKMINRNGYVVETNDVLSVCTLAQSNVQWLDTAHNSKNATRYLASYLSKSKVKLSTTFALLASVRKEILTTRVSSQFDRRTPSRTAKHLLARMHNMSMKSSEISATQCAQYLLGMPVFFSSEAFQKCFMSTAYTHVMTNRNSSIGCKTKDTAHEGIIDVSADHFSTASHGSGVSEHSDQEDPLDISCEVDIDNVKIPVSTSIGVCPTYSIAPSAMVDPETGVKHKHYVADIPVAQHTNYAYRGQHLEIFNLIEYCATVQQPSVDTETFDLKDYKFLYQIPSSHVMQDNGVDDGDDDVGGVTDSANIAASTETCTVKKSRKSNGRFPYDSEHPLKKAGFPHTQKLLSLQYTITLSGKQPPKLPHSSARNVHQKLDEFAKYYLILFKPWDDPTYGFTHAVNWSAFADFVNELDTSTCAWHKGRLAMLQTMIGCQSLSKTVGTLLAAYRVREATRWSDESDDDDDSMTAPHDSDGIFDGRVEVDFYEDLENDEFGSKKMADAMHNLENSTRLLQKLKKKQECLQNHRAMLTGIYDTCMQNSPHVSRHLQYPVTYKTSNRRKLQSIPALCEQVIDDLKAVDTKVDVEASAEIGKACPNVIGLHSQSSVTSGPRTPSPEQQAIITSVMDAVTHRQTMYANASQCTPQNLDALTPGLFLMHGAAGTGKTNVVLNLSTLCKVVAVATTGNAATLIQDCTTVHKRHNFPFNAQSQNKFLRNTDASNNKFMDADVYLLDEVSMLNCTMLSHIDQHLRYVRKQHETMGSIFAKLPFGGLVVVLSGDFRQLPPVSEAGIYKSVVQHVMGTDGYAKMNTPLSEGTKLFTQFRMHVLTVQQRLQEQIADSNMETKDPDLTERQRTHRDMIENFRTSEFPLDSDEILDYLSSRQLPLHQDLATVRNKVEDSSWLFATHIVTNNAQRHDINWWQAIKFSEYRKVPMLWWEANVKGNALNHLSEDNRDVVYDNTTELKDIFVPEAPCYLTCQLSPEKGIANGTQGHLHSLVFSNPHPAGSQDHARMDAMIKYQDELIKKAKPGKPMKLLVRPTYVNVTVKHQHSDKWPYATLPSDHDTIGLIPSKVAPLAVVSDVKAAKKDSNEARGSDDKRVQTVGFHSKENDGTYISPAEIVPVPSIQYDLGFATTVHKSQGQTMGKIIVDLNDNPFLNPTLAMIYVILTRVRNADDIRLMPFKRNATEWKARLRKLKFPPELQALLSAYGETGVLCPVQIVQYMTMHQQRDGHLLRQSKTNKHDKTLDRSRNQVRRIPDPLYNISFVNSVMYSIMPVYLRHLVLWPGGERSQHHARFHAFMSALMIKPDRGYPGISLKVQEAFYGQHDSKSFKYIAQLVPRHAQSVEGGLTATPSEFLHALARELEWTEPQHTKCSTCKNFRACESSLMAELTVNVSSDDHSNCDDLGLLINAKVSCTQCHGIKIPLSDDTEPWAKIQLLTVYLQRKVTGAEKIKIVDEVTVHGHTYDLVSVIRQRVNNKRDRHALNKSFPYDACIAPALRSGNKDTWQWITSILDDKQETWQNVLPEIEADACVLMYARRGAVELDASHIEPKIGDFVHIQDHCTEFKSSIIRSIYHPNSYEVVRCDETIRNLSRNAIVRARYDFLRLQNNECTCGTTTCVTTLQPVLMAGQCYTRTPHLTKNVKSHTDVNAKSDRAQRQDHHDKQSPLQTKLFAPGKSQASNTKTHLKLFARGKGQASDAKNHLSRQNSQRDATHTNRQAALERIQFLESQSMLSSVDDKCQYDLQLFHLHAYLQTILCKTPEENASQTRILNYLDTNYSFKFYGHKVFLDDVVRLQDNGFLSSQMVDGLINSTREDDIRAATEIVSIQYDKQNRPVFCINPSQYGMNASNASAQFDLTVVMGDTLPQLIRQECTMGLVMNDNNLHWYLLVLYFRNEGTTVEVQIRDSHASISVQKHSRHVKNVFATIINTYNLHVEAIPSCIHEQHTQPTFESAKVRIQTENECGIEVASNWTTVLANLEVDCIRRNWSRQSFNRCISSLNSMNALILGA